VVNVPTFILPVLHYPADLHGDWRLAPRVLQAGLNQGLGIIIVHVRPRLAEAAHVAQTIHAPADRPLGQGVLRRPRVLKLEHQRGLAKGFQITIEQRPTGGIGESFRASPFAPGADDRDVHQFEIRVTVVAGTERPNQPAKMPHIQWILGMHAPPRFGQLLLDSMPHDQRPIPRRDVVVLAGAVGRDAQHERLPA
jgi:hypothetical protein